MKWIGQWASRARPLGFYYARELRIEHIGPFPKVFLSPAFRRSTIFNEILTKQTPIRRDKMTTTEAEPEIATKRIYVGKLHDFGEFFGTKNMKIGFQENGFWVKKIFEK